MAEIRFEGSLERTTYIEAQRLFMRPRFRTVLIFGAALALLSGVLWAAMVHGSPPRAHTAAVASAAVAAWLLICGFLWFLTPILNTRRVEKTSRMFGTRLRGTITETTVHLESEFGTATLPWEMFFRFKKTDDLVILYQSAQLFNVFPRSFFASDEDWRTLCGWVAEKVPSGPRRR